MSDLKDHTNPDEKLYIQDILASAAEARAAGFHHTAEAFEHLHKLAVEAELRCKSARA
ncbi:hypothetical protein ACRDNQ_05900 [Palleronia sp. KMU-117]|uniref:hypothetical protein n=1 Tax=Palleronia sp. KMU-117 TaxID=3434108 RepID=UPI003D72E749